MMELTGCVTITKGHAAYRDQSSLSRVHVGRLTEALPHVRGWRELETCAWTQLAKTFQIGVGCLFSTLRISVFTVKPHCIVYI